MQEEKAPTQSFKQHDFDDTQDNIKNKAAVAAYGEVFASKPEGLTDENWFVASSFYKQFVDDVAKNPKLASIARSILIKFQTQNPGDIAKQLTELSNMLKDEHHIYPLIIVKQLADGLISSEIKPPSATAQDIRNQEKVTEEEINKKIISEIISSEKVSETNCYNLKQVEPANRFNRFISKKEFGQHAALSLIYQTVQAEMLPKNDDVVRNSKIAGQAGSPGSPGTREERSTFIKNSLSKNTDLPKPILIEETRKITDAFFDQYVLKYFGSLKQATSSKQATTPPTITSFRKAVSQVVQDMSSSTNL